MNFRIVFFIAALTAGSATSAQADLVGHWSGDGDATESVAGRNGTLIGGAGFAAGRQGQAFGFDGVNDFVSVPDDNAWTFGNSPFTIALWANFNSVNQQTFRQLPNVFIGHDNGAGATNKWVFFFDDDGHPMFLNGPGNIDDANFLRPTSTFNPTVGQWHHFAVTRSANTYTFFVDGLSLGTAVSAIATPNASAALTIGQAEGLGHFNGRLDEIRIYDNALSSSQIQQLAAVPEPSSTMLLALSFLGAFANRRRKV
jgi:hypothetical protein